MFSWPSNDKHGSYMYSYKMLQTISKILHFFSEAKIWLMSIAADSEHLKWINFAFVVCRPTCTIREVWLHTQWNGI